MAHRSMGEERGVAALNQEPQRVKPNIISRSRKKWQTRPTATKTTRRTTMRDSEPSLQKGNIRKVDTTIRSGFDRQCTSSHTVVSLAPITASHVAPRHFASLAPFNHRLPTGYYTRCHSSDTFDLLHASRTKPVERRTVSSLRSYF